MLTISPKRYALLTKTANNCKKLAEKKSNEEVIELIKNRPELNDVEKQLLISDILCGDSTQEIADYLKMIKINWFKLYLFLYPLRDRTSKPIFAQKDSKLIPDDFNQILDWIHDSVGIDNKYAVINKLTELLVLNNNCFKTKAKQKQI